jgi:hypothetical protein
MLNPGYTNFPVSAWEYPYRNEQEAERLRSVMATIITLQEWMEKVDELPIDNDKRAELLEYTNHLLMDTVSKFMKEAQKPQQAYDPFTITGTGFTSISSPPSYQYYANTVGGGGTTTNLTFDTSNYLTTDMTLSSEHMDEIKAITFGSGEDGEEEGR